MNVRLVQANQNDIPSHRAFKSTSSRSFGLIFNHFFQLRNPLPSTCPLPAPIPPPTTPHPQLTPSLNASGIENNQQEPGSCRKPKPLPDQSRQNGACRVAAKQPLGGIWLPLVASAVLSQNTQIWLVVSETGISDRLHLVVVTRSPSCLFLFLSLYLSWAHPLLPLSILGLVALSSSLSFFSSPQTLPTLSSSAPHVQHCAAPTPPYPLFLHYSLHLDPVRLGQTAGGSPHALLLVQDISASGTETETTNFLSCGFGRKVFVKLLPVAAPWVAPSDWMICSKAILVAADYRKFLCTYLFNGFLWECRQKLSKYASLPFHTRHYCCHVWHCIL